MEKLCQFPDSVACNNDYYVALLLQRPALIPFHSVELRLIDGEGKWELRSIGL